VVQLTPATGTDGLSGREFIVAEPSVVSAVFRRARRHSRRVRLLRIAIPVLLAVGIGVVIFVVWFSPLRILAELPRGVGGLILSGSKMTMAMPKIAGYTHDRRRYELSANAAAQDPVRTDVVNLEAPRASLEMLDNSKLNIEAAAGIFDRKAGILTLRRDILLTSTSGYEMRLNEAVVDVRNGSVISEQPVEVKMLQATIQGNRLEVSKSGELIRFDGGVTMLLLPDKPANGDVRTQAQ
jgi:lipopolysaccharide export system protein LptC